MHFVPLLETTQDTDGILNGRFIHIDWLEAAFKCGIFFDMLAVFVECGCTDGVEFTAR